MAEYLRFARTAFVALAIPFIVLVVDHVFLRVIGAVVSGSPDFTAYMATLSGIAAIVGITRAVRVRRPASA
ncbi:MAG: hypothetical protein O9284_18050 [Steroidobacteraceae bacterium]|jgi:cytosine permease|nr:hypothetical protein [Steroidobacteraceae bacterium]